MSPQPPAKPDVPVELVVLWALVMGSSFMVGMLRARWRAAARLQLEDARMRDLECNALKAERDRLTVQLDQALEQIQEKTAPPAPPSPAS